MDQEGIQVVAEGDQLVQRAAAIGVAEGTRVTAAGMSRMPAATLWPTTSSTCPVHHCGAGKRSGPNGPGLLVPLSRSLIREILRPDEGDPPACGLLHPAP